MRSYALSHLSDFVLVRDLKTLVAHDRTTTAAMLAHIAEVDARKLYLPAACSSMYAYCVQELGLSEGTAYKRIQAARAARRFPSIYSAVADGRLHVSAVVMLAAHLTEDTADELLAGAERKSKSEIEQLIANKFPRPDLPAQVLALATPSPSPTPIQLSPGTVLDRISTRSIERSLDTNAASSNAAPSAPAEQRPRVAPLAPQRYAIQFTADQDIHDALRKVQSLLGHRVASGDVARVIGMALKLLVRQLEKSKISTTDRPQRAPRPTHDPRHIPAHVRRAVWKRDHGQCTFVSEGGRRCAARANLEFDHVREFARGGEASVDGIRLRCRAHNQYTAECVFGAAFMSSRREAARRTAGAVRDTSARAACAPHASGVP